jgi:5-deoxy-glucuronate isomerase
MTDPQVLRAGHWHKTTPEMAGWQFVSFEVVRFGAHQSLKLPADGHERALIALGGRFKARVGDEVLDFGERETVFDGLGYCLYVPRDTAATITGTGAAELAVASAPAKARHSLVLVTPDDLSVERRGAGNATRQVSTVMPPVFPADRLHVVEVWTPGGNWSSFPPHKHEHDVPGEAQLEEIYYYRLRDPGNGWAIQRVYSPERDFELDATVRDRDICLIPWGYHTTVAAHGHDLYYLNVLAGPAPERTLQAREDPTLAELRTRWENIDPDPRVPFVPQHPTRYSSIGPLL